MLFPSRPVFEASLKSLMADLEGGGNPIGSVTLDLLRMEGLNQNELDAVDRLRSSCEARRVGFHIVEASASAYRSLTSVSLRYLEIVDPPSGAVGQGVGDPVARS